MLLFSHMMDSPHEAIFKALADPTRRQIMDLLRENPMTTGGLDQQFKELSRYGVMKHLGILTDAGLVTVRREGKYRWNYLNAVPLQQVYERWVKKYEAQWASQLIQLKNFTEHKQTTMETMQQAASTMKVEVEITINAHQQAVWLALIHDISSWWRTDFYTSPKTQQFVLEPKLGGLMYEDHGNGQGLVWAEVIGIDEPGQLQLKGHLFPAFGGPAVSFLEIKLEASGEQTILKLTDSYVGNTDEKMRQSLTEGWQFLFGEGLKPYAEGKSNQE